MSSSVPIPLWLPHWLTPAGLGAMLEPPPGQSTTLPATPTGIEAATHPATQPTLELTLGYIAVGAGLMLVLSLVVTGVAWALGAFRSRSWPLRVEPDQPVWPLAAALGLGVMLLLTTVITLTLGMGLAPEEAAEVVDAPSSLETTVTQMQISAITYAVAVGGALAMVVVFRRFGFRSRLGLGLDRLPWGLVAGGAAVLLVMPWMWASGAVLQTIRFWLGYSIDPVHPILEAIQKNPDPRLIAWGAISALVVAPVAEEVVFRGLLQTSLVHGLPRLLGVPPTADAVGGEPGETFPRVYRWVGIVLASIVFALLHPPWSVPLIFILAVMLGYLYERTGNLWAPITVHFVFNAVNVLFVLLRL